MNKKVTGSLMLISLIATMILITQISVIPTEVGSEAKFPLSYNVIIRHIRNGTVIWEEVIPNLIVNQGKDFAETQISSSASVVTDVADDISLSNDATTITAADTVIAAEYTTCSLDRQTGTYSSTGIGTWNVVLTFTNSCAGAQSVQKTGINRTVVDLAATLIAAALFTQRTLQQNDQIQVTWQGSV